MKAQVFEERVDLSNDMTGRQMIAVGPKGSLARHWARESSCGKERKKTKNPREGWEDGTPPPHRNFKKRSAVLEFIGEGLVCE